MLPGMHASPEPTGMKTVIGSRQAGFLFFLGIILVVPGGDGAHALEKGARAPGFCLSVLDEAETASSRYCPDGRVGETAVKPAAAVVVSFFAMWCGVCKQQLPALQTLRQRYAERGLEIVVIGVDKVPREEVRTYLRGAGITLPVVKDVFSVLMQRYEVSELPVAFLLDRRGVLVERFLGFDHAIEQRMVTTLERVLPLPGGTDRRKEGKP